MIPKVHADFLHAEKHTVGHAPVGFKLLSGTPLDLGGVKRCKVPGFFCRKHPEGPVIIQVDECGRHDAVIHEFERPSSQPGPGHMGHGVRRAPIHLHKNDQLLDLIPAGDRLGEFEYDVSSGVRRGFLLDEAIRGMGTEYHFVLIDCAPTSGILGMNALLAANEIMIPVTYTSNWQRAADIMSDLGNKYTAQLQEDAEAKLTKLTDRFPLKQTTVEPSIYFVMTDNWIEVTLRFVVDAQERRKVKAQLNRDLLQQFQVEDNITIASATYDIVGFPALKRTPDQN